LVFPTGRRIGVSTGVGGDLHRTPRCPLVHHAGPRSRPERARSACRSRTPTLSCWRASRRSACRRRRDGAWAMCRTAWYPSPWIASGGVDDHKHHLAAPSRRALPRLDAVTGAIGGPPAFALPGTVIRRRGEPGRRTCHLGAATPGAHRRSRWRSKAAVQTPHPACPRWCAPPERFLQGELHIRPTCFSKPTEGDNPMKHLDRTHRGPR